MLIAFHSNQLGLYGTEVAMHDYCKYNQLLLGHQSIAVYPRLSAANDDAVVKRFEQVCEVCAYDNREDLDALLKAKNVDLLYAIKAGHNDGLLSRHCPTMVHAVFPQPRRSIHGSSYAFVSEWLSETFAHQKIAAVPHIVDPLVVSVENLRSTLRIPADAFVVGGYGSLGNFNIEFVKRVISKVVEMRPDIWFLFMNYHPFVDHCRALFLPGSSDRTVKSKFVNACDLMIHARSQGETFGLACAEFSSCNKPILTYALSPEKHHLWVLGENVYTYQDEASLMQVLRSVERLWFKGKSFDAYASRYTPERVMEAFDRHLIHPCRSVTSVRLAKTVALAKTAYAFRVWVSRLRGLLKQMLTSAKII